VLHLTDEGQPTNDKGATHVAAAKKATLAIASGILAVGASLGVASLAYADTTPIPSPPTAPRGIPSPEWPGGPGGPDQVPGEPDAPDQVSGDDALIAELSRLLGIDQETLRAMLEEARSTYGPQWSAVVEDQLDAAVKAGLLTQAEADAVRKAIDESLISSGR
jgi:hypothetical protein